MLEYFPDPYPDEILYSVWARYSDKVRIYTKTDVFRELFGNKDVWPVIDLPCYLGYFVDHLPFGHAYTVDYFIQSHTLFPFYASFLFKAQHEAIRKQMITGNGSLVHILAGIAGNSIIRPSWLRYCPECIQRDKERFGESYWHRLHQVPGVEICPNHLVFIENSPFSTVRFLKEKRFISSDSIIAPSNAISSKATPYFSKSLDIAQDVIFLLENAQYFPDTYMLAERYASLLSKKGFLTKGGSVRKLDLMEAFIGHYSSELLALLHCDIGTIRDVRSNWPAALVTPASRQHRYHPLQQILVIRFLDSTVKDFFTQRPQKDIKHQLPFGSGPWPCLNPVCEYYQKLCISTCEIKTYIEKKYTNNRRGQFTCSCGFTYARRGPDQSEEDIFRKDKIVSYGPIWEQKLRELWFNPQLSLRSIANELGIDVLRTNRQAIKLQLPVPRTSSYQVKVGESRRRVTKGDILSYRTQWLTLMEKVPESGTSLLRKLAPQVYEWLFKYDRKWLAEHHPGRKFRVQSSIHERLFPVTKELEEEDQKDICTSEAIRNARNLLLLKEPPQRITLKSIIILVPQVKSLKSKPDKAPLTIQALNEVVETTENFAIRRIWWAAQNYQKDGFCPTKSDFCYKTCIYPCLHIPSVQKALDEAMILMSQLGPNTSTG